jgi:hypothetical protein
MATLRKLNEAAGITLQPEHLIGRGAQCNLRLTPEYISTQHAVIRWVGHAWELADRGSRNGTLLNGSPVEPGRPRVLERGVVLTFGHPDESWEFVDAGEPQVGVLALDSAEQLLGTDGVIGIPSDDDPACTVYRDTDGCWKLELPDTPPHVIEDGYTWTASGRPWRFSCPSLVGATATSEQRSEPRRSTLCFGVSRDEEFVELTLESPSNTVNLGSRGHNYLLLLLARARSQDREAGLPESTCGWLYKEDLADSLRITPQQVDGEIHRIRKHFAQHGLEESSTIVERRTRTKQLRLGATDVRITAL